MNELPVNQRAVLELREMQGKTYQEIASVLEMDINLVKVSIHRARKKLREAWTKENEYGIQGR
jgi:RNA polymerase sigma-70 factor (ECF subfamily)